MQLNSHTVQRKVSPDLGDQIRQASVLKVGNCQSSSRLNSQASAKKIMGRKNKKNMNNLKMFLSIYKIKNLFSILAFDETWNPNDVKGLLGNLHVTSLLE